MNNPSLWARFQSLEPTTETGAVAAIRCGMDNQHLLVRGPQGEPALLLSCAPRETPRADIKLKHIGIQFDRTFEIEHSDDETVDVGNFCKFTCGTFSTHLHQYFVELMTATVSGHHGNLTHSVVDEIVNVLLELFRKLSLPAERSIKGLWGELLLIYLANSPGDFVDAWHIQTSEGFDFSFADKRIEVKTTERASRDHEFALKQVRSGRRSDIVASVILSRSSAGLTNLDLSRLISEQLNSDQQGKLWRLVIETLGEDADFDSEQRFDLQSASDSLVFVYAEDVPAPEIPVNWTPFVTDIRFRSNINILCPTSTLITKSVLGH